MNEQALTVFQPKDMKEAMELSRTLAMSSLLPDALKGKPADVLVSIITGQELGLTAMQSIRGMHVVKGKAILSADLAVALVKRHPDCIFFRLAQSTDTIATYETERKGEGKTSLSFTSQQAQQAGLGGDNWRKYPAAMLRARASAALARAVYPDIMLGVYEEDEARDFTPKPERAVNLAPEPAPAPRLVVVDVKAGETEEQATKRAQSAPLPTEAALMSVDELREQVMKMEAGLEAKPNARNAPAVRAKLLHFKEELAKREAPEVHEPGSDLDEAAAP